PSPRPSPRPGSRQHRPPRPAHISTGRRYDRPHDGEHAPSTHGGGEPHGGLLVAGGEGPGGGRGPEDRWIVATAELGGTMTSSGLLDEVLDATAAELEATRRGARVIQIGPVRL